MSRPRQLLPYVLVLAFGLRCAAAAGVERVVTNAGRQFLVEGDANGYWDLARNLLRGTYEVHQPPRRALRMPGFPTVLAAAMLTTGSSRLGVRLWLAAVGTLCCWLVYLLGCEVLDPPTALLATACTAIVPVYVGTSVLVLSETTFTAAMLASVWVYARLLRFDDVRLGWAITAGLLTAITVYVRPSWLLALPGFVLADALFGRNRRIVLARAAVAGLAFVVALAPWAVRNALVLGQFVPTTTWMGPTLYDGLHPGADGRSDMQFYEDDVAAGRLAGLDEYEIDQHYRRRAWSFVAENPGTTLSLAVRKQLRFWSPWPNADEFRSLAIRLGVVLFSLPLFVLAARGAWLIRGNRVALAAVFGPIAYFAALHLVFVGSIRYRIPAEFPLWLAASAAVLHGWPSLRAWLAGAAVEPPLAAEGRR